MAQVTETIIVKAPAKICFDVITDYEKYPEFFKETKNVIVEKRSGGTSQVTFTIELIKKISYTLKITEKPPKQVSWTFVKGDFMKSNEGKWILEEIDKGTTKVTYAINVELGLLVPSMISKMLVGSSLPTMLQSFKKRVETKTKEK